MKLADAAPAATIPDVADEPTWLFPPSKTVIVQNFPRTAEFQSADAPAYGTRAPVVAYVGGVSRMRGVEEMVRAIGRVSPELDARLVLAGSLDPASLLDELDGVPGWDRTAYLGWQGPEQLRQLLSSARVGLVTLHPLPNYLTAFPTKLFEYMAAGIPVVASDFPLWRQIVTDAQCGFLVDPMNPSAIAEAVEFLLRHPSEAQLMGERGRNAACSKYDWKTQGEKLVRVYEDVLQGAEA